MSLLFALLGHPVSHSMSPAIHGAAYAALGLAHRYELIDVPDLEALARALERVRQGELAGANVTVPWKRQALALADRRATSADRVGAANVLCRAADGALEAHNTDVPALRVELELLLGAPPRDTLVLGSGGAALAAVVAAQELGATRVGVTARRWSEHEPSHAWSGAAAFSALGAELLPWPGVGAPAHALQQFCRSTNVVVQATSAGMHGGSSGSDVASVVPWPLLAKGAVAYDLVYNPPDTAFLQAARAASVPARHGLGMLVGQAVLAIELWLGVRPEARPLYVAAELALAARSRP